MTVVAWDGIMLAADKMAVIAEAGFTITKIWRPEESDYVFATTGDLAKGLMLVDWYMEGAVKKDYPAWQDTDDRWARLICAKRGECFYFESHHLPIKVEDSYMAWGSGRDYAMGAMAQGATAEEAVIVTSKFCISCGCGVDAFELA